MIDNTSDRFTFENHVYVGEKLKEQSQAIEVVRASIASRYRSSGKKEMKQLETALNNIKLVQTRSVE